MRKGMRTKSMTSTSAVQPPGGDEDVLFYLSVTHVLKNCYYHLLNISEVFSLNLSAGTWPAECS